MSCTPSSQATTYIINTKWGESSSVGSLSLALQDLPSFRTLTYRSTPNQRGNFSPALAAVRLYRILQLDVFVFWPCTRTPRRLVDAGIQDIVPSVFTKKIARPGTSEAIAAQFLPPCVCTASYSLMSSSSDHVPIRPAVRAMLGFKASFHLSRRCFSVRPGTSAAIAAQFLPPCVCTASFSWLSSSSDHEPVSR
jgi:hypothetical protein